MCDKIAFHELRQQTAENSKQIADLAKSDAVQSVQIKSLAEATAQQGANMTKQNTLLIIAIISVLVLAVLALIFGALGKEGFNGVTKAAPNLISVGTSPGE